MAKQDSFKPKRPARQMVYFCTKDGFVGLVTTDMREAIKWKAFYGATIWMAMASSYTQLPKKFLV